MAKKLQLSKGYIENIFIPILSDSDLTTALEVKSYEDILDFCVSVSHALPNKADMVIILGVGWNPEVRFCFKERLVAELDHRERTVTFHAGSFDHRVLL